MKSANSAALGFRAHSGWAAAVALGGSPRSPEVLDRRRIALIESGSPGGVQPYHVARTMDLPKAEEFIKGVIAAIDRSALIAVKDLGEAINGMGRQITCCGIVLASGRALPSLEATLRSHAMVHTAEHVAPPHGHLLGRHRQSRENFKLALRSHSGTRSLQVSREAPAHS